MHSLLAVVGIIAATVGLSLIRWTPVGWDHSLQVGSAAAVMACTTFGLKTVKLTRSWMTAWLGGALMAGAVLLWAPAQFAWLPICIGLGFGVHLLGDALTIEGVPFLWPLKVKPPRALRGVPVLRSVWKENSYFAVPLLGHAGSWRENLLVVPLALYALWGVGASAVLLSPIHF